MRSQYARLAESLHRAHPTTLNQRIEVFASDLSSILEHYVAVTTELAEFKAATTTPAASEPVGEAEPYSGRSADHTQAIFRKDKVPVGTKLFTTPPDTAKVLREARDALESALSDAQPYIVRCKTAIASINAVLGEQE